MRRLRAAVIEVFWTDFDDRVDPQPRRVAPNLRNDDAQRVRRQRRLLVRLDRVVEKADVLGATLLDQLPGEPHLLRDGILAGKVSIRDRQVATIHLRRVTVDRFVHLVAGITAHPVVRFIHDHKGTATTFEAAVI